ncbi:MAG: hypothetical protein ABSC06_34600 [Rhodopila sp.]
MLSPSDLHVFCARSNPLGWKQPQKLWETFATHMLELGVNLTVVECAYGNEPWICTTPPMSDPAHAARFMHVGVRAKTRGWSKENCINLGVWRRPEAKYIGWFDTDILFRRPDIAMATLHALQHYDVVQPWATCYYDLGPNGEHITAHTSFAKQFFDGKPLAPDSYDKPYWMGDGGLNVYPHSGFAWAMTRQAYDWTGGLFEVAGMGSGDHHMALSLAGLAAHSLPPGPNPEYCREVMLWQARALQHINGNVGYVAGTIEHAFHGRKPDRGYISRWQMFVKHGFDPLTDLKRNATGVFEFATAKPDLRRDFDRYLQARNEDINAL